MKRQLSPQAAKVKDYILKHRLLTAHDKALAAVSGGADSVGLLLLLDELKAELGISLAAAHFDHCLRSVSAAEGDFVANLALSLDIPCYRGSKDIGALAKGHNLQEVARRERYRFLRESARDWGADKIATAHHADDQAETVLLHLLRGSGLEGLAAIAPAEGELIRPLLCLSKAEIEGYCRQRGQDFCLDLSNLEDKYLRNKVRHHLLPLLAAYNPRIVQSLGITAEICREENKLLQLEAKRAYERTVLPSLGLEAGQLAALPAALQRRVLRLAYQEYAIKRGVFGGGLSYERTEAALALKEGRKLPLTKGLWLLRQGEELIFFCGAPAPPPEPPGEPAAVTLGGWRDLANGEWQYRAEIGAALGEIKEGGEMIALPAAWLPRLSFRVRKEGDIFAPAHMEGHKKIKKLFQEAKVPQLKRAEWPLLLLDQEIVWLPRLAKAAVPPCQGPFLLISCRMKEAKEQSPDRQL